MVMHPSKVKKVLSDENTLDVLETALAVREDIRIRTKRDKPRNPEKELKARVDWVSRQRSREMLRLRLKEFWNKNKKK